MTEQMIYHFFSKKAEGRELSNFHEGTVVVEGRMYNCGEAAFHGMKYIKISEVSTNSDRKMVLEKYGEKFETKGEFGNFPGNEIKKKGGKNGLALTEQELRVWLDVGRSVQSEICAYKYNHDANVKRVLDGTQGKFLIHPAMRCSDFQADKKYWEGRGRIENGMLTVRGANMLGNIWMMLRDNVESVTF
jgi:predicted NAD-dependent protein-ADP-ribosyltransferase YbiA (DUF1768 family)